MHILSNSFQIDFDETEYIHFMIKKKKVLLSIWKFEEKLAI